MKCLDKQMAFFSTWQLDLIWAAIPLNCASW